MKKLNLAVIAGDGVGHEVIPAAKEVLEAAEKKRLDIEIDFKTGGRFPCPDCGKADCPVHDTVKKTWRHLNFLGQYEFTLPDAVQNGGLRPLRDPTSAWDL